MFPHYDEPLFRPPSEGRSLIFQVTLGCSWNQCTFCEMYTSKQFRPRPWEEVQAEIREASLRFPETEKIFLADGDALVLSNKKLIPILNLLHEKFPHLKRVSSYALPKNLLIKSVKELRELREAGLTLLYYGVESGDPLLLQKIKKGATQEEMIAGTAKAHEAGMILSTTNLLGVG
ncbi:MAG: radical SAM protein, partial [Deltaproteobacteria bacterium]|nr:radical SAM protein [Deltaproteobacteria bacterium]